MRQPRVALVYNKPGREKYGDIGEEDAEFGVLDEVEAIDNALSAANYSVVRIPLEPPVARARQKLRGLQADLIFNLFEGFNGQPRTEAAIADTLWASGIPCTGCPPAALRLALDKAKTKRLLKSKGMATPDFQRLSPETLDKFRLHYPCLVKPAGEDASHGLSEESVVSDLASLQRQVTKIWELFGRVLVEEFLDGREFNATVMGNKNPMVLAASEIEYNLPPGLPRILTFAAKWQPGSPYYSGTEPVCPAHVSPEEYENIKMVAMKAFQLVGCRGYARVDMRTDSQGVVNVLEVNPNPDISLTSGAATQCQAAGMTHSQFIEKIALLAMEKAV